MRNVALERDVSTVKASGLKKKAKMEKAKRKATEIGTTEDSSRRDDDANIPMKDNLLICEAEPHSFSNSKAGTKSLKRNCDIAEEVLQFDIVERSLSSAPDIAKQITFVNEYATDEKTKHLTNVLTTDEARAHEEIKHMGPEVGVMSNEIGNVDNLRLDVTYHEEIEQELPNDRNQGEIVSNVERPCAHSVNTSVVLMEEVKTQRVMEAQKQVVSRLIKMSNVKTRKLVKYRDDVEKAQKKRRIK